MLEAASQEAQQTMTDQSQKEAGFLNSNITIWVETKCPYCGISKSGRSLRCHIQACSMRNEAITRKVKHENRKSEITKSQL